MKYLIGTLFFMLQALCLFAADWPLMEIRTKDGQVFPEATVEQLTPSMVDISYKKDGYTVLKGIDLADLTPELQQKFNYDPKAAAEYQAKIEKYKSIDLAHVTFDDSVPQSTAGETEEEKLARIRRLIQSRLAGKDIEIDSEDLDYVITAGRHAVTVSPVEQARTGTVVKVLEGQCVGEKLPGMIMIHDVELPEGQSWIGFIYPTGLKARLRGENQIPVFCDSLKAARNLLDIYLDIYSEFALNNKSIPSEALKSVQIPDQSVSTPQQTTSSSETYSGIDYKVYNYCFGISYWPVYWYRNYHPWRPRLPRPLRPPKPTHHPAPPIRPGYWQNIPGRPVPPHKPLPPKPAVPNRPLPPNRPVQPNRPVLPNRPAQPNRPVLPLNRPVLPVPVQPSRPHLSNTLNSSPGKPGQLNSSRQLPAQPKAVSSFSPQIKSGPVSSGQSGYREVPVRPTISGHDFGRGGFRR